MNTHKYLRATAVLAAALSLAACGYTPKLVSSPTGDKLPPALDVDRMNAMLTEANQVATAADGARDWQQLVARFTGPSVTMRNAEYVVVGATSGANLNPLPLTNPQAMAVQQAGDWPRYAMTVSPAVKGQALQVFAFVQSQARANYSLWGHVKLFPKVKFPATFKPEVGSPAVAAKKLLRDPGTVAADYVALLNDPNAPKDKFDTSLDAFLATYNKRRDSFAQVAAASRGGLNVTITAKPGANGYVAMGTMDGGALVMTDLTYNVTMQSNRRLDLNPLAKAMTGKSQANVFVAEEHTALVLFEVPAAGTKGEAGKIKVLGAAEATTAMSAE